MSIEFKRRNNFLILRLSSDTVTESDENAVKDTVEQALRVGVKNIVFSVLIGSLPDRVAISRLLRWCKETISRDKGQLLFLEKNGGDKSVFGDICEALHIPMCKNNETSLITMDGSTKDI